MAKKTEFTVYGALGSGSVCIEAALTLIGAPYRVVEGANWSNEAARKRLQKINPLMQVPALILPNGELMTESAAILIWLTDSFPKAKLAPKLNSAQRAAFLRWMVYIPASIYSMFWVRDVPSRLTRSEDAEAVLLHRTAERIAECWRIMNAQVGPKKYILDDTLSVLDIYVAICSRWTPGRARFYKEAPKLADIVKRVDAEPRLQKFWPKRFPFEGNWERK
ncbi:MAG: glutathione S-transferase family protein [Pseudomonadota bacterium]